jgi:hypothetical protein
LGSSVPDRSEPMFVQRVCKDRGRGKVCVGDLCDRRFVIASSDIIHLTATAAGKCIRGVRKAKRMHEIEYCCVHFERLASRPLLNMSCPCSYETLSMRHGFDGLQASLSLPKLDTKQRKWHCGGRKRSSHVKPKRKRCGGLVVPGSRKSTQFSRVPAQVWRGVSESQ